MLFRSNFFPISEDDRPAEAAAIVGTCQRFSKAVTTVRADTSDAGVFQDRLRAVRVPVAAGRGRGRDGFPGARGGGREGGPDDRPPARGDLLRAQANEGQGARGGVKAPPVSCARS